jgi:hypothetical protein
MPRNLISFSPSPNSLLSLAGENRIIQQVPLARPAQAEPGSRLG